MRASCAVPPGAVSVHCEAQGLAQDQPRRARGRPWLQYKRLFSENCPGRKGVSESSSCPLSSLPGLAPALLPWGSQPVNLSQEFGGAAPPTWGTSGLTICVPQFLHMLSGGPCIPAQACGSQGGPNAPTLTMVPPQGITVVRTPPHALWASPWLHSAGQPHSQPGPVSRKDQNLEGVGGR